ncbi:hypothetical protein ON010_g9720 [Phytophthora cinnamomi]|nr:hypothetical protein ON010_g9720 [Phytophthora cinnamomi]
MHAVTCPSFRWRLASAMLSNLVRSSLTADFEGVQGMTMHQGSSLEKRRAEVLLRQNFCVVEGGSLCYRHRFLLRKLLVNKVCSQVAYRFEAWKGFCIRSRVLLVRLLVVDQSQRRRCAFSRWKKLAYSQQLDEQAEATVIVRRTTHAAKEWRAWHRKQRCVLFQRAAMVQYRRRFYQWLEFARQSKLQRRQHAREIVNGIVNLSAVRAELARAAATNDDTNDKDDSNSLVVNALTGAKAESDDPSHEALVDPKHYFAGGNATQQRPFWHYYYYHFAEASYRGVSSAIDEVGGSEIHPPTGTTLRASSSSIGGEFEKKTFRLGDGYADARAVGVDGALVRRQQHIEAIVACSRLRAALASVPSAGIARIGAGRLGHGGVACGITR